MLLKTGMGIFVIVSFCVFSVTHCGLTATINIIFCDIVFVYYNIDCSNDREGKEIVAQIG